MFTELDREEHYRNMYNIEEATFNTWIVYD